MRETGMSTTEQRDNSPARIFDLYKTMCLIRAFEERAEIAFDDGFVNGSIASSTCNSKARFSKNNIRSNNTSVCVPKHSMT